MEKTPKRFSLPKTKSIAAPYTWAGDTIRIKPVSCYDGEEGAYDDALSELFYRLNGRWIQVQYFGDDKKPLREHRGQVQITEICSSINPRHCIIDSDLNIAMLEYTMQNESLLCKGSRVYDTRASRFYVDHINVKVYSKREAAKFQRELDDTIDGLVSTFRYHEQSTSPDLRRRS